MSTLPIKAKENHLQLVDISKTFSQRDGEDDIKAVDNVTISILEGEFLTLLGPSGCGKTTTLRLIAGFEMPTSGKIILGERDITHQPPNKRDMSLVFQSYALFPHMSVYDNIAYGLRIAKLSRSDIDTNVTQMLAQIGLGGLGERRPNELSGGQQQRVALARALVMEPTVMLFDEPLSNLDAKLRQQMRIEIHALQRRMNITSVYVTHDQIEAMAMSDRIVVMNDGYIEQMGAPSDIYRFPVSHFVADFIGRANFVKTEVKEKEGDHTIVELLKQTVRVQVANSLAIGDCAEAVLRPESMSLREDETLLQADVAQMMYLGSEVEYIMQVGEERFVIVDSNPRANKLFNAGETVGIDFDHEAVHLLSC